MQIIATTTDSYLMDISDQIRLHVNLLPLMDGLIFTQIFYL